MEQPAFWSAAYRRCPGQRRTQDVVFPSLSVPPAGARRNSELDFDVAASGARLAADASHRPIAS